MRLINKLQLFAITLAFLALHSYALDNNGGGKKVIEDWKSSALGGECFPRHINDLFEHHSEKSLRKKFDLSSDCKIHYGCAEGRTLDEAIVYAKDKVCKAMGVKDVETLNGFSIVTDHWVKYANCNGGDCYKAYVVYCEPQLSHHREAHHGGHHYE